MRMAIGARLGVGMAPALLALVLVGWFAYDALDELELESRSVPETVEVLQGLSDISAGLAEAESNARGFRLRHDERFAQQALEAAAGIESRMARLQGKVDGSVEQRARLEQLQAVVAQRTSTLNATLTRARQVHDERDEALAASAGRGSELGRQARALISDMRVYAQRTLAARRESANLSFQQAENRILALALGAFIAAAVVGTAMARTIVRPLERLRRGAERIGAGDYGHRVDVAGDDEIGRLATCFNEMGERVQQREARLAEQDWIATALAGFTPVFQSGRSVEAVSQEVAAGLAALLDAPHLAIYLVRPAADGQDELIRSASFAADDAPARLAPGQGLAGQCMLEHRPLQLREPPAGYITVHSALGSSPPAELLVLPALFEGRVNAVIEIAALRPFSDAQRTFLDEFAKVAGLAFNTLEANRRLGESLHAEQVLGEDLRRKQDELHRSNAELQAQSDQIRASERALREQQEELRQANEEQLEANTELRQLTIELNEKARQLAEASEYKSQFLANMSHELRTPLNSLLILSKLLAENSEGTLSEKQVEYARTIHNAGNDLLELISDVLDLAKIESGTVRLDIETLEPAALARSARETFEPVAASKGLAFDVVLDPQLPASMPTDARRTWQIVKNLLSNALKFTERGGVTLSIKHAQDALDRPGPCIAFEVRDSGIGIPPDRQADIFEAFRQVDSGLSRKFGGTGLGLSISRKLATMLGGAITVESTPGAGSVFTLLLPLNGAPEPQAVRPAESSLPPPSKPAPVDAASPPPPAAPDRPQLVGVVDDALVPALQQVAQLRGLGTAVLDDPAGLAPACQRHRVAAVVLDTTLGHAGEGWVALGWLKQNAATRHIPVHVIAQVGEREKAALLGASSVLLKPPVPAVLSSVVTHHLERMTRPHRRLLVVEDDPTQRQAIVELIGNGDVHTSAVGSGADALQALQAEPFDCVVLDLGLPDMDGAQVLAAMSQRLGAQCPPVLVYTGRPIAQEEERRLRALATTIIVKGVRSPERLLHETAILLSRQQARLPKQKQEMIERARREDPVLSGRKVLVVDDDIRNVFAITAALEDYGVDVLDASGGQAAIDALHEHAGIDLVLMDVMMPGVDGLEATRRLRADARFADLPIIVITAKAMPGDREACLAAGASDYLTKPLDMERLKAMARAWLAS